jgi:hypothetical protein
VIRFADEPARPVLSEPALGGDTEAVLDRLRRERLRQA